MNAPSFFNGSLWINLKLALDSLETYLKSKIIPKKLTFIQWYTMRVLYDEEVPPTMSFVAEKVGRKNNSFTHVVDGLEAYGLVMRVKPLTEDHRLTRLHLTEQAEAMRPQFLARVAEIEADLQATIGKSVDELLQILVSLQNLAKLNDKK